MLRFVVLFLALAVSAAAQVVHEPNAAPRVLYGVERLQQSLKSSSTAHIVVGTASDPAVRRLLETGQITLATGEPKTPESFVLLTAKDGTLAVIGADNSGALYGCLELAKRIPAAGGVPHDSLNFSDAPAFVLRGPRRLTFCPATRFTNIRTRRNYFPFSTTRPTGTNTSTSSPTSG